MTILLHH